MSVTCFRYRHGICIRCEFMFCTVYDMLDTVLKMRYYHMNMWNVGMQNAAHNFAVKFTVQFGV